MAIRKNVDRFALEKLVLCLLTPWDIPKLIHGDFYVHLITAATLLDFIENIRIMHRPQLFSHLSEMSFVPSLTMGTRGIFDFHISDFCCCETSSVF